MAAARCETCRFRAIHDKKPRSLLGRLWRWHTGWCPGWRAYLRSLPEAQRQRLVTRYRPGR